MGCRSTAAAVQSEPLTPIAVIGLPGVGKTSFIEFLSGDYNPRDPPVPTGGLIQRQVDINGRSYLFYDVCGYTSFADAWVDVIQKSKALILFFDKRMLETGSKHISAMYGKIAPAVVQRKLPILVLVNSADPSVDISQIEALNTEKFTDLTLKVGILSGLNDDALHEFEWLASQL